MKVVHFNTQDRFGGAGRAVYRLHKQLLKFGIDSTLLVSKLKYRDDETVKEANTEVLGKLKRKYMLEIEDLPFRLNRYYRPTDFSVNWLGQLDNVNEIINEADIVGLYWIGRGFISPSQIGKINKPIVWRLSDLWPFTGGCHYPGECRGYINNCGQCPQIKSSNKRDLTYQLINKKVKHWKSLDITIVAPSNWIAQCALESTVFKDKSIKVIPSGVDHDFFSPFDKEAAKASFHIKKNSRVILFGAAYANTSLRKGYDLLVRILAQIDKEGQSFTLLIFGNDHKITFPNFKHLRTIFLNEVKSPFLLRMAYCASDAFIAPYREDNLPNTLIEAMSCGTPCLAFNVGGISDLIDHKQNGYLVSPYNISEAANGLKWLVEDVDRWTYLSNNARSKVINGKFTLEDQAKEYIRLYKTILNKNE